MNALIPLGFVVAIILIVLITHRSSRGRAIITVRGYVDEFITNSQGCEKALENFEQGYHLISIYSLEAREIGLGDLQRFYSLAADSLARAYLRIKREDFEKAFLLEEDIDKLLSQKQSVLVYCTARLPNTREDNNLAHA